MGRKNSFQRALELVKSYGEGYELAWGALVIELIKELGVSYSRAIQLVAELEARGAIRRIARGRYIVM